MSKSVREQKPAAGVAMMVSSALSNQVGAATAALAFPVIGPTGVVAVRQWVAGAVLLSVGRPRLRSFTWRQWWPILALAVVFATMNLSLYTAIDRIGLGLAVTLEFLGPLAVALSASRRALDLICALVAGAAVVVLARPQPTTDYPGIALGLLAAGCWASYILLNRTVGSRVPGVQGSAAAAGLSALLYVPVGVVVLVQNPPTVEALGYAATAGVLSSAVPFLVDLLALRRVPARFFGAFMSVNPVLAALVGLVMLGQAMPWVEWLAIAAIVISNTVSVLTSRTGTPQRPTDEAPQRCSVLKPPPRSGRPRPRAAPRQRSARLSLRLGRKSMLAWSSWPPGPPTPAGQHHSAPPDLGWIGPPGVASLWLEGGSWGETLRT